MPTDPTTLELDIDGMHCTGCETRIRSALEQLEGVEEVSVDHQRARAQLHAHANLPEQRLRAAVQDAGDYRVGEIRTLPEGPSIDQASVAAQQHHHDAAPEQRESLYPLFLIVGYILGTVLLVALATGQWAVQPIMRHFMAGFFIVFSFFKLLDLRGFAGTFRGYDPIARAIPRWGFVYPFVELALGIGYLINIAPIAVNIITILIMGIGGIGVFAALRSGKAIRCACLGTVLNLPMTTVTLVEDFGMAAMAAVMLALSLL